MIKQIFIVTICLVSASFIFADTIERYLTVKKLPLPPTTLDALQGKWVSSTDTNYSLKISGLTKFNYFQNQLLDSLKFSLEDSCITSSTLINVSKVNGFFIQEYEADLQLGLCYRISYISATSLELFYDGKHLSFNK